MSHSIFKSIALVSAMASALAASALAQTIAPTRVGPVSQYGQLMTGKNSQGKGRIYGSCDGVKDGAEVQVRGMSLYWSMVPKATEFWTPEGISTMVRDMNIQIVRAAMGTTSDDWWGCLDGTESCGDDKSKHITGYASNPEFQTNIMNTVVQAAIENDIYVIIDWHSHQANEEVSNATKFFTEMAQKWGKYDHVIFELFNEPKDISWSTIKSYAEKIVPVIRQYSDNLILVGNRQYDQNPQEAIGNTVSGENIAYTFHYYANSHCWSGQTSWNTPCEGANAQQAIDAGLSVFVSEWGTANADGGGNPDQSRNTSWQNWMDGNQLSWANWSASKVSEGTAAFEGSSSKNSLQYTTSGNMVKGYLASNPTSYTACKANVPESSSSVSAISFDMNSDRFNVSVVNRTLMLQSTASGETSIDVFDILGNSRLQKKMLLASGINGIALETLPAGTYLVRVRQGANMKQVRFQVR
ncbi:cellulase family glycosylhydrolase [Fibrobacter sp. UBA2449]|uniref:cellulase family glycosylhydrolase n=1 Tax=Fibrobacter sp. UBA2449 TaxID=1946529 RepID=UPI0025B8237D|nr:cellulase family glycosylhydrolase [Fibrobacter sp. UBA2449]